MDTTTDLTDDQLRAIQERARNLAGFEPKTTALLQVSLPNSITTHSGMCLRCRMPLPPERLAICEECDVVVEHETREREDRDRAEAIQRQLLASGLPAAYQSGQRTLSHLPTGVAPLRVAAQLGTTARGLFLYGRAGTWKTSFACAFLADVLRGTPNASGRYVFVPSLLSDIHASYNGSGLTRTDIVAPLIATPRLVLDDLGKEKPSEHAAAVLFEILDGRYRSGRGWMIVTSNLSLDGLSDRFAHLGGEIVDPIRRRLAEMTIEVPMTRGAA